MRVALAQQLERDLLLGGAEGRLAVLGEDLLDRLARAQLDLAVDVDRQRAEPGRDRPGGRGLARSHEADADDRPPVGSGQEPRHPIRSL